MKLLKIFVSSVAFAAIGSGAFAGEATTTTKTTIKPLKIVKSTQTSIPLGLGGLGVGGVGLVVVGGIVVIGVVASSTSGT